MNKVSDDKLYDAIRLQIEESRSFLIQRVNPVLVYTYSRLIKSLLRTSKAGNWQLFNNGHNFKPFN